MKSGTTLGALVLLAAVAMSEPALAQTAWDTAPGAGAEGAGDAALTGGAGTWDQNTTANWTEDGGTNNIYWSSTTTNIADFSGAGGAVSVGAAGVTGVNGITFSGAGYTIGGPGTITLGATATLSGAVDGQIDAVLAGGGTSVTKSGSNIITLTGANTYTGTTIVTSGTLALTGAGSIASTAIAISGGSLTTDGGAFSNTAAITQSGGSIVLTGSETIASITGTGGSLDLNGAGVTLTTGDASSTSYVGVISGAGALTKAGTGTFTLTGANTYSGTTTISSGTLRIGNGGTSGSLGTGNVVDNAGLTFNRTDNITVANDISGTGSLTQDGAGTLTLTGALSYTGTTTVTAGSIVLGDATHSVTLPGNASVTGGNLALANGSLGTGTVSLSAGQSVVIGLTAGLTATAGTSTITGAGTVAFQNSGSAGTAVINSTGLVDFADSSTASNAAITLTGGGIGQIRNSATGGSATFTVNNTSSLSIGNTATGGTAQVILNAGGTLDISSHALGNVVVGSIEGSGGVTLGGNTLEAGGNNRTTTYSGVIGGTGGLEKKGTGNLVLTGTSTYTGNTNVSGGTLSVNGSIASSAIVFVNNGGTLGGNGTVSGLSVGNGGTVAPGNSIGTLTVNGNVTFNSGSVYSVEVDNAGAADKLVVNGGVTINAGATLAVKPFNVGETGVTYGSTTTYTVITATGGVTGTFSTVTDTFAFLDATLAYTANSVAVTLKRNDTAFAAVANTQNQRAAASGVNSLGGGNTIYGAILGLSAADARTAFDLLSGEIHASVQTALIEDSRFVREAANQRLLMAHRGAIDASRNVWAQAYGAYGTWSTDGNAATVTRATGGFLIGSDGEVFDSGTAGVFIGYGRSGIDAGARRSSSTINSYHLGAYGGMSWGELGVRLVSAYSFHDVSTSRDAAFTGFSNTLSSRYLAATGQVSGEVSYDFKIGSAATLSPFANLAYVRLDSRGFREVGGAAALTSGANSSNTLFSTIGVATVAHVDAGTLPVDLSAKVGWRHAGGAVGMARTLSFDTGSAFAVGGVPIGRDTAVIGAELAIKVAPTASLSLRYSGQVGSGVSDHAVNARFDMRF